MTRNEFDESMVPLRTVYGDKAYPEERVVNFYEAYKNVRFDVWVKTIQFAINTHRQAPLLNELDEALNKISDNLSVKNSRRLTMDDFSACDRCEQAGWFYINTIKPDIAAGRVLKGVAACSCDRGKFLTRANKLIPWESYQHKECFFITPADKCFT